MIDCYTFIILIIVIAFIAMYLFLYIEYTNPYERVAKSDDNLTSLKRLLTA